MPPTLTPQEFVAKWRKATLKERAACQEHFLDLCRLLGQSTPGEAELQKRTLTNLYKQRPTWLAQEHGKLDAAVPAAHGWPAGLADDEILARLLVLNEARAG